MTENLEEIRKAEFYSIPFDETVDVLRIEQISIYLKIASADLRNILWAFIQQQVL